MNKKIIKQTKYCNILEQVKVSDNEYTYTVEKIYIKALRRKELRFCVYKCTRRGDETYIIRMFRKSFRENFRQGIPEGLLVLAAAAITAVDMLALHGSESRTATLMMIVITVIAVMIFVTSVYMFALQSRYENTVIQTIINAARLAVTYLPRSAGMAAIWLVWILMLVYLYKAASLFFLMFGHK